MDKPRLNWQIRGHGLEIGALHNPAAVPDDVRVTYVDRLPVEALRAHYPELSDRELVSVDIVSDAEHLDGIADNSQDFVVANHVFEHLEDPIRAILNMCRVLRPGGVVSLVVPDKRASFDVRRSATTWAHVWRDFRDGPETSRRQHYEEWTRVVNDVRVESDARQQIDDNIATRYNIHFHAWTPEELHALFTAVAAFVNVTIEAFSAEDQEVHVVLKRGLGPLLLKVVDDVRADDPDRFRRDLAETLRPEPWHIESVVVRDDAIEIAGWAIAPNGIHARVMFTVNGRRFTDVEFPIARADIARTCWFKAGADRAGFRCRLNISRDDLFAMGAANLQCIDRALGKPINEGQTYVADVRGALSVRDGHDASRVHPDDHRSWLAGILHTLKPNDAASVRLRGAYAACLEEWTEERWRLFQSVGALVVDGRTFTTEAYIRRHWYPTVEIVGYITGAAGFRDIVQICRRS